MNFVQAVEASKAGTRVRRAGKGFGGNFGFIEDGAFYVAHSKHEGIHFKYGTDSTMPLGLDDVTALDWEKEPDLPNVIDLARHVIEVNDSSSSTVALANAVLRLNQFKENCEKHWLSYGAEKQHYLIQDFRTIFGYLPKTMYDVEMEKRER
jgi:hypothetical protein